MKTITPLQLYELMKTCQTARLIDVRTEAEYADVHAEGAQSIPLNRLDAQALNGKGPVYVICQSGGRSAGACRRLQAAGVDAVNVTGSTAAWAAQGLPAVRDEGAGASCAAPMGLSRRARLLGLLTFLIALVLGAVLHPVFLGVAAAVWIGLLIAGRGACPLGACAIPPPSSPAPDRKPG